MTITISRYPRVAFTGLLLATLIGSVLTPMQAMAAERIEQWADDVWKSALAGNQVAVERALAQLPADQAAGEHAARFQELLEKHRSNRDAAEQQRREGREKAMEELREHLAERELSKALRSAVEVQTLSDDYDAALKLPEVAQAIEWAREEIATVKDGGDWLRAQELLFRLRTLYDDTSLYEEYQRYDEQLEQVNLRVSLLSRYAPKRLHELRNKAAARLGDEPLEQSNIGGAEWRDRIDGIDSRMLRAALRGAATDHIEGIGWRPLLEGGLEALLLLGGTDALAETFPSLEDGEKSRRWKRGIEREIRTIRETAERDLDFWLAGRLLDRLVRLNEQTLELDDRVLFREFGDGAMHNLDQFSEIIWPDRLRRFRQQTEGNFVGVGILIRHDEKRQIVVVNPLDGTPAYFAGVKPDDVIVEVDGESTVGWTLNEAVEQITGPKGVTVMLGIRREGEEEVIQIPIVRDTIRLHSVQGWWKQATADDGQPMWDWYIDPVSRIAYVRLTSFNEETFNDLRKAWRDISAGGRPNGLILDVRFNPGGLLTSAVQVANLFLQQGVIVSGEDKDGVRAWSDQRARRSAAELAGLPTVILVNKGSASGSEIVAGALQAHGAAVVVGERTYGKGSVQTVHQIASSAALKLTTQYYRLPPKPGEERGALVHRRPEAERWGVEPDILVTMTPAQFEASYTLRQQADIIPEGEDGNLAPDSPERPDINDLLTEGHDPQLQTALLILQARALGDLSRDERHAGR